MIFARKSNPPPFGGVIGVMARSFRVLKTPRIPSCRMHQLEDATALSRREFAITFCFAARTCLDCCFVATRRATSEAGLSVKGWDIALRRFVVLGLSGKKIPRPNAIGPLAGRKFFCSAPLPPRPEFSSFCSEHNRLGSGVAAPRPTS